MPPLSSKTGCLGIFFVPSRPRQPPPAALPFAKRDAFLSPAELSFYRVLDGVMPPGWRLIAKVNLADLFYVRRPNENRSARNRIDRKHVDFVICDAATMNPLVGIELDDASHDRPNRQRRDALVDRVFEAAGLPLLRVRASRGYHAPSIKAEIDALITHPVPPPPPPVPS